MIYRKVNIGYFNPMYRRRSNDGNVNIPPLLASRYNSPAFKEAENLCGFRVLRDRKNFELSTV